MKIQPITLSGKIVRLEPLSKKHIPGLTLAGQDEQIWRYLPYGNIDTQEKMARFVDSLLDLETQGNELPFAAIHLQSGQPVGCTRYMEISVENRKLEIGGTWYGVDYQRTGVNTECKYLLLKHAFETLECIRVQFKTDSRNHRSQKAIERIGAVQEGVLRNHMILPDGHIRDSVYYSIIDTEWPKVKDRVEKMLSRSYG
jgi:RimJ/RimL family protein N-acetyltransferase